MADPTAADVYGTSAWQAGNAALIPKFSAILQKYGIVPDSATLAKYGLSSLFDPSGAAGAATNPNSVFAQLGRARDVGFESNMHTAQGHNALFSGAFRNSQDETGRGYERGVGQAGQDELGGLLGVGGDQAALYQTVYGQLLNKPVDADPTVYNTPSSQGITADSPIPQVSAPIGTSTPETVHDEGPGAFAQAQATGTPTISPTIKMPSAGVNPFHIPATTGKALTTKPKISTYMGAH